MKSKLILAMLLICNVEFAAGTAGIVISRGLELSLQNLALKKGERIESIEVSVAGARIDSVHVPMDWSIEVGAPVSGWSLMKGEAAHGVGMPFTTDAFQRFLVLALYGNEPGPLSIKVKVGLYLYDQREVESERIIELPPECIGLQETH